MSNSTKFLLHANQFTERGDSVTLMSISKGLREELGIESIIAFPETAVDNNPHRIQEAIDSGFTIFAYSNRVNLEDFVASNNLTHNYVISDGSLAGIAYSSDDHARFRLLDLKHCTQAVFRRFEPHGEVYAYISSWLFQWSQSFVTQIISRHLRPTGLTKLKVSDRAPKVSWVPHIVEAEAGDAAAFRNRLGVPSGAKIIGRIGGKDQFSDKAAQAGVLSTLDRNPDVYAVMVNTEPFGIHQRLIYCDVLSRTEVWDFYAACHVFINGRKMGESFGFSIVEPLSVGKPVIAPHWSRNPRMDRHHIQLLKPFSLLYRNSRHFRKLVERELQTPTDDQLLLSTASQFGQKRVMQRFAEVYLGS